MSVTTSLLHDRTGRLEKVNQETRDDIRLHDRTGRLEMSR